MDPTSPAGLQGLRVVSFESRRAKEMAELIRRYGGEPIVAPSMREIPLTENHAALDLLPQLEAGQFDLLILMTGVGTKTLNDILLTRYSQEQINAALERTRIAARGPKPVAALKEIGLKPALIAPEPNTWREVLTTVGSSLEIRGARIAIQEYGVPSRDLVSELEARGANVATIPVYRWDLPHDLEPLRDAIRKLTAGEADVALFTNGAQVEHLLNVAAETGGKESLMRALKRVVIGSVGPVCTQVLEQFGLKPDIEPPHPKMGALIAALAASARQLLTAKNVN